MVERIYIKDTRHNVGTHKWELWEFVETNSYELSGFEDVWKQIYPPNKIMSIPIENSLSDVLEERGEFYRMGITKPLIKPHSMR
tara:strand:- start:5894 stop:6145 length:252 start_codon:yes stop_codon:yes gene_type:complete